MTATRLKSYRLTEADIEAIARVRESFRLVSDTAAVQLGLRAAEFRAEAQRSLAIIRLAVERWEPTDFASARAKSEAEEALTQLETV